MGHQLGGEREAALRGRASRGGAGRKIWAVAVAREQLGADGLGDGGRRVWSAAAQLIDAEIDKATAAGPVPQYYLGLAAEVLLAAGRPADGLASP